MARAAHKGLRHYDGNEIGNITLGQGGFEVVSGTATSPLGHYSFFKVLGGAAGNTLTVKCLTYLGDHLSSNGGSAGNAVALQTGEIIYGPFKSIDIVSNTSSLIIIAYKGMEK